MVDRHRAICALILFLLLVPATSALTILPGAAGSRLNKNVLGEDQPAENNPPASKEIHVSDPAGDVRMQANNQTAPDEFDHFDILGFWVDNETLNEIEMGLQMSRLDGPSDPAAGASPTGERQLTIQFFLGKAEYQLSVDDPEDASCGGRMSATYRFEGGGYAVYSNCVPITVEPNEGIVRFAVPRQSLTDENYTTFGAGDLIEGLFALATTNPFSVPFIPVDPRSGTDVYDRAPDFGVATNYESALSNVTSSGDISLFTEEPIRLSNGESTTLVYPVNVTNHGSRDETVILSIDSPEPAWSLRVPPRVNVEPGESLVVPVILSMGFEHRHGDIAFFQVRAESSTDPNSWSIIHLGVYWLDTPQPAGHHNKLWLHSGPLWETPRGGYSIGGVPPVWTYQCVSRDVWFNPIEDDVEQGAEDGPVPSCPYGDVDPTYATAPVADWTFDLQPGLLIGLDFDITQEGRLITSVESPFAVTEAALEGILEYCDTTDVDSPGGGYCPGEFVPIASGKSAPRALGANTPAQFEIPIVVDPEWDIIPYARNSNIRLRIALTSTTPTHAPNAGAEDASPMLIIEGSELTLPLIEYHDPIEQSFQNVGVLTVASLSPFEKFVNPGRTSLFQFQVANTGTTKQNVQILLEGHNKEWARVVSDDELDIAAKTVANVTLAVTVPVDASAGERSELFVVAENKEDQNVVAISRLRATVVDPSTEEIPDEDPETAGSEGDGAPGVGAVALLAMFAVLAFIGRRRGGGSPPESVNRAEGAR